MKRILAQLGQRLEGGGDVRQRRWWVELGSEGTALGQVDRDPLHPTQEMCPLPEPVARAKGVVLAAVIGDAGSDGLPVSS